MSGTPGRIINNNIRVLRLSLVSPWPLKNNIEGDQRQIQNLVNSLSDKNSKPKKKTYKRPNKQPIASYKGSRFRTCVALQSGHFLPSPGSGFLRC